MSAPSIVIKLGVDAATLTQGFARAQSQVQRGVKQLQGALGVLGGAFAGLSIGNFGRDAFTVFAGFQQQMQELKAVSGATQNELATLEKNARDLGASTKFAASEVAGLQVEYSKLGFAPEEIEAATGATLALAQATGANLVQSAEIAGATVRAFNLDASETGRVADVIAESANASALGVVDFGEAMKYVAPIAATMNVSLEETTAALAILSDAGQKGTVAGNGLKNVMLTASQQGKTFTQFLTDAAAKNLTLAQAVDLVGREAAPAFLNLVAGVKRLPEVTRQLENSAGAAARMAAIMDDSDMGAMKRFQSALESIKISLGSIISQGARPVFEALAAVFAKMEQIFRSLPSGIQTAVVAIGALAAAAGPVVLAFGAFTVLGPAISVALGALASFAPVLAGIAAAVSIAYVGLEIFSQWLQQAGVDLGGLQVIAQNVGGYLSAVWGQIQLAAAPALESIRQLFFAVFDSARAIMAAFFPEFQLNWQLIGQVIALTTSQVVGLINQFTIATTIAADVVRGVTALFLTIIGKGDEMSASMQASMAKVQSIFSSAFAAMMQVAQSGMLSLYDVVTGGVSKATSALVSIVSAVETAVLAAINSMGQRLAEALNKVLGTAQSAVNKLAGVFGKESNLSFAVAFDPVQGGASKALDELQAKYESVAAAGRSAIESTTNGAIQSAQAASVTLSNQATQLKAVADAQRNSAAETVATTQAVAATTAQATQGVAELTEAATKGSNAARGVGAAASQTQTELNALHERAKELLTTDAQRLQAEIAVWQQLLNAGLITQQEFQKLVGESKKNFSGIDKGWADVTRNMTSELQNFIQTGEFSFRRLLSNMVSSIAQSGIAQMVASLGKMIAGAFGGGGGTWGAIISGIGSIFGGAFADGGSPPLGKVSLVGERGPELFVPRRNGTIIPNHALGAGAGGDGATIVQNINLQPGVSHEELARILPQLREQTLEMLRQTIQGGGRGAQAFKFA